MFNSKLRTTIALFTATVALAAGFGPVSAASAQDNDDDGMSKEEACAYLEDGYNLAAQYASEARAAGDMAMYEYFSNLMQEIYLDAEFDWGCDFATEAVHPGHGDDLAPSMQGYAVFEDGSAGPVGPTFPATKNGRNYQRWLRSKHHAASCRNQRKVARSLELEQANLTRVAAHFTNCGWARDLPAAATTATDTPPPAGTDTPPQNETPPATDGAGGSSDSGPLL